MANVNIGKTIVGGNNTVIAVPIVARNKEEIEKQAFTVSKYAPDLIEFRADHYEGLYEKAKLLACLESIKSIIKDIPLLFTVRTSKEGGEVSVTYEVYQDILMSVAKSGLVDAIDVEAYLSDETSKLIADIKSQGVKVIASYHDFDKTPGKTDIVLILGKLIKSGADIAKLAVMPTSARDVVNLLDSAMSVNERYPDTPVATMAMGKLGVISRLNVGAFGNAITFASVGKESAPGQVDIEDMRSIIRYMK